MKSFLQAFNRPAYIITATSVSIDDLIDGLFGHNWIHRCESLSSQSTSTIRWLSEQRNESDKRFLSLDRPDRQQQPDQWNQWFTEKQCRTRAFAERTKTVLVKGRVKRIMEYLLSTQ